MVSPETSSKAADPRGSPDNVLPLSQEQRDYLPVRYKVALGMLVVVPAVIVLPPRKLDLYTFGLGLVWVYSLNEVVQHGGDGGGGGGGGGAGVLHAIGRLGRGRGPDGGVMSKTPELPGWKGESVYSQHREREEEGKGIGGMISESVLDVWQQEQRNGELPLTEKVKNYERLEKEQKEKEAVEMTMK